MVSVSVFDCPGNERSVTIPFPAQDAADTPAAILTLRAAGSMRFRWNEKNPRRDELLASLVGNASLLAPTLVHSQKVIAVHNAVDLSRSDVDGIITTNAALAPVITVADCMPIYLWDPVTGVFGVLHSGWRGTGIAAAALETAAEVWDTAAADVRFIFGPHIHECCYTVDEDRAEYFSNTFGPSCVGLAEEGGMGEIRYHLSLAEANRLLLTTAGVNEEHILHCTDCTGCEDRLGSFRRETAHMASDTPLEEMQKHITVMAALITRGG